MFKPKNLSLTISLIVVISLIVGWGVSLVLAWTNPGSGCIPPDCNVATPINVSSTGQTKIGNLTFPIMYDYNNTAYYVDPASLSHLNYLHIATNNTWIPYNGNNQNYIRGIINTNNAIVAEGVGTIRDAGGGWVRTYGATGWYNGTYGGGWYMADTTWLRAYNDKYVYTGGIIRADSGFQVDGYEMVGSNADMLYANRKNTTGGGIWVSDDGGFYDYNIGPVDFRGSTGIRVLESDGSWGNNYIKAAYLCIQDDCRNSWPVSGGGTIGGGGTINYIAKFTSPNQIGNSSMVTSGDNITIDNGGLLVEENLSVGGWTNITGQLRVSSTIEADGQIYAHGNIQTEGRFYGLLGRSRCYWTGEGQGVKSCRDGDYVAGIAVYDNPARANVFCCGSSQDPPPAGGGGGEPPNPCLAEGTKIKMADGTIKNIENVKVGEKVLAYDIGQKKLTEQMVLKTSIHPDYKDGYYLIETESGHQLKATGNHPLYVGDSYVLTEDLKPLDILYVLKDGNIVPTRIKSISFISEPMSVYNFEIEKDKNYFGNDILVHNATKPMD